MNINDNLSNPIVHHFPLEINNSSLSIEKINCDEEQNKEKQEEKILLSLDQQKQFSHDSHQTITTMLQSDDMDTIECNYCRMSNVEFQERLFMVTSKDQRRQKFVRQWLEIDRTLLQWIRIYTCTIAHVYILKIELDFYKNYMNTTQSVYLWLSQMSKIRIKAENIDEISSKIPNYIKHQFNLTEERLRKAITKLIHFIQIQERISNLSVMDIILLKAYIITFVRQDYQRLHDNFERKIKLFLLLKADDVRLVKEFYDLKPNLLQIHLARCLWNATIQEEEEKQKVLLNYNDMIDSKRLSSSLLEFEISSKSLKILKNSMQETSRIYQTWDVLLTSYDTMKHMQENRNIFLNLNQQQQQQQNLSSIRNSQWKMHLLMNIIESRQRILKQYFQFDHNIFKQILLNYTEINFINDNITNDSHINNDDIEQIHEYNTEKKSK